VRPNLQGKQLHYSGITTEEGREIVPLVPPKQVNRVLGDEKKKPRPKHPHHCRDGENGEEATVIPCSRESFNRVWVVNNAKPYNIKAFSSDYRLKWENVREHLIVRNFTSDLAMNARARQL
jgi:hypothetical protein